MNQPIQLIALRHYARGDFDWRATDGAFFGVESMTVPMLLHLPTGFYCKFGFMDENAFRLSRGAGYPFEGEFFLQRSPAEATIRDTLYWRAWTSILMGLREWLAFVRRETTDPDFWHVQPPEGLLPVIAVSAPNSPFTDEEQRRIAASFDDVRAELDSEVELTPEQKASFESAMQEATESATRLGRKDWRTPFWAPMSAGSSTMRSALRSRRRSSTSSHRN